MSEELDESSDPSNTSDLVETIERNPFRRAAPGLTRVRMHVSYDGTDFAGWQRQRKQTHVATVQGTLETVLSKIADQEIKVIGASRTDAGVHAVQQVAHFDWPKDPSGWDFRYAIQCMTPKSLVVKDLFLAPPDFHAIAVVTDKIYKYRVLNRVVPSALRHRYTHWWRHPLDLDFLNECSQFVIGQHDFKAFQSAGTEVLTTVRSVHEARWTRESEDILEFTIRGDGFLKQMVRNIVGTVIDLYMNGHPPDQIKAIMATLDRRKAGPTAPPQGLFLERVNYPEAVDIKCRKL
ncbi:MAG: tRNA pseudouridine(38-40) synthase TruA [Bdellovibrionota bacterium]